jgi:hypothetical protein
MDVARYLHIRSESDWLLGSAHYAMTDRQTGQFDLACTLYCSHGRPAAFLGSIADPAFVGPMTAASQRGRVPGVQRPPRLAPATATVLLSRLTCGSPAA